MKRVLAILALIVACIYGGDYFWLRLRIASENPNAAMGSVTRFYATKLKDGKLEVFYDQPHVQTCVNSLFPHLGYTPCWYLKKPGRDVMPISFLAIPPTHAPPYL